MAETAEDGPAVTPAMPPTLLEMMVSFFGLVKRATVDEPEVYEQMTQLFQSHHGGHVASKQVANEIMELLSARPNLLAQARIADASRARTRARMRRVNLRALRRRRARSSTIYTGAASRSSGRT